MRFRLIVACVVMMLTACGLSADALAAEADEPDAASPLSFLPNIPTPTLGGTQFWADELFFHRWRIQRNAVTGHYRLLDGNNFRHKSGTLGDCRQALESIKQDRELPPMQGTGVILLHGLGDTRGTMGLLAKHIEQRSEWAVFNVTYPSTRHSIEDHAQSLARIVDNLEGIERIHFVGHSLGNIVIRRYLADQTDPDSGRRPDGRIGRIVMIGPPNHGSVAATALGENRVFKLIAGEPGQQLGREWVWLEGSLATPEGEFGIIAGGLGNDHGMNPLLPGDDDGVVTVASTRLTGARDYLVVPLLHALIPGDKAVQEATLRFLEEGCFIDPERRQPLEK